MSGIIPSRERNGRLLPPAPLPKDVTYILDTSALRGLRGELISAGREKGLDLAISPYTVREVFCHLGEEGRGGFDFSKRNQILKAKLPRLLPDPHASVIAVLAPALDIRKETDDRIRLTLDLLSDSELPEELADLQGRVRAALIEGAKATRELHAVFDKHFLEVIHWVAKHLEQYMPIQRFHELPDEILFAAALGPVRRESWEWGGRMKGTPDEEALTWLTHSYFTTSYVIARARDYAIKARTTEPPLPIDPHDMEDAAICAHLSIVEKSVLVTSDRGTIIALEEAHGRLRRIISQSPFAVAPGPMWLAPRVLTTAQLQDHLKRI